MNVSALKTHLKLLQVIVHKKKDAKLLRIMNVLHVMITTHSLKENV